MQSGSETKRAQMFDVWRLKRVHRWGQNPAETNLCALRWTAPSQTEAHQQKKTKN